MTFKCVCLQVLGWFISVKWVKLDSIWIGIVVLKSERMFGLKYEQSLITKVLSHQKWLIVTINVDCETQWVNRDAQTIILSINSWCFKVIIDGIQWVLIW